MSTAARVTDEHVTVPAAVTEPVVVTFDGQYVWSFSPRRDGVRHGTTWRVPWPEVIRPELEGTTRVRLGDLDGETVLFESDVAFRGSTAELHLRDRHGHPLAVDRAGHLTRVFSDTESGVRRHIVEGAARALGQLRDQIGIDAHLSYGCLLGAVRDGHMIGHDSDADLAYLSAHTHPADIMRESFRMERELRKLGWKVLRMSGADLKLFLPLPDGRVVHIDIFGAFHVGDTFYQLGGRSGTLPREALTPASNVVLEGVELAAPADPERVLAFLYGPSWRVPDPSFQNVDPVVGLVRIGGWFWGARRHLPEWNLLLRTRRSEIPREPSPFAPWVSDRIPADARVVDLGCGTGRDSAWFATQGREVIGADYSGAALRMTRRLLKRRGVEAPTVRSLSLNDLRSILLMGAELARLPQAPYLYARGLVDSVDAEARANLWLVCSMVLRRGGSLHVEYAATRTGLGNRAVDGLVERVSTATVRREIEASGGRVVHVEHGPGTDFFGEPDPHVARIEARWDLVERTDPPMPPNEGGAVFKDTIEESPDKPLTWTHKLQSLPAMLKDLRSSVQENRQLNRRVAELTDVVTELLIPLADRDEERARELLAAYRETTLGA
jgi:SAM-dependent methyltransferase